MKKEALQSAKNDYIHKCSGQDVPQNGVDLVSAPVEVLVQLVADAGDLGLVVLLPALPLRLIDSTCARLTNAAVSGSGTVIDTQPCAEQLAGAVPTVQALQLQRTHLLEGQAPDVRDLLLIVFRSVSKVVQL